MPDTAERLASATDTSTVGEVLADHTARVVGYGSYSFVPFLPGIADHATFVVRSSEFPIAVLKRALPGMIVAAERELGAPLATFSVSGPSTFGSDLFPRSMLERTSVFQDFWRPLKLDRILVTLIGRGAAPLGYYCLARSARERPFERSHTRAMEALRGRVERSLAAIRWLGSADLACSLDALARAFPSPAYLFDLGGQLRWMSDDGAVRLSIESARVGASRLVRGNDMLERLSRFVILSARKGAAGDGPWSHGDGLLRRGERIVVRRFEGGGRPLLLVALEPPHPASAPGRASHLGTTAPRLGAVESRVASLAAEGYAVVNIASVLGVTESTVRTHLRRIYLKFGVHNRAELACALLRPAACAGRPAGPKSPRASRSQAP